jgi:hypothetical protein
MKPEETINSVIVIWEHNGVIILRAQLHKIFENMTELPHKK